MRNVKELRDALISDREGALVGSIVPELFKGLNSNAAKIMATIMNELKFKKHTGDKINKSSIAFMNE